MINLRELRLEPYRAMRDRGCPADPTKCYYNSISTPRGRLELNNIDAFIGSFNLDISTCILEGFNNVR